MTIDVLTLFPAMCRTVFDESITGRAQKKGLVTIHVTDIRDYTQDKHRRVDDYPYGGGMGMLMQAEPVYNCVEAVKEMRGTNPHKIYLSPKGKVLTQARVNELARMDNLLLICGHYEGLDERAVELCVDEEISIGDYVLTGGETAAFVLVDAVARLIPGVLSDEACYTDESIYGGLLEYPQYTRPEVFLDKAVPPVLLSGHEKNIKLWRRKEALRLTRERRPDLLEKAELDPCDLKLLDEIKRELENNG